MFKDWGASGCTQIITDANGKTTEVATLSCLPVIFANLLTVILGFAGLMTILMFMLGSFKFMHAGGNPEIIKGAKNRFTYAMLGLVIVILSFVVISIISYVTGVKCLLNLFNTTNFRFGCH
jgi:hypothetical protein